MRRLLAAQASAQDRIAAAIDARYEVTGDPRLYVPTAEVASHVAKVLGEQITNKFQAETRAVLARKGAQFWKIGGVRFAKGVKVAEHTLEQAIAESQRLKHWARTRRPTAGADESKGGA